MASMPMGLGPCGPRDAGTVPGTTEEYTGVDPGLATSRGVCTPAVAKPLLAPAPSRLLEEAGGGLPSSTLLSKPDLGATRSLCVGARTPIHTHQDEREREAHCVSQVNNNHRERDSAAPQFEETVTCGVDVAAIP